MDDNRNRINAAKASAYAIAATGMDGYTDARHTRNHRGTPARYHAYYSKKHGHRIVVDRRTGEIVD